MSDKMLICKCKKCGTENKFNVSNFEYHLENHNQKEFVEYCDECNAEIKINTEISFFQVS